MSRLRFLRRRVIAALGAVLAASLQPSAQQTASPPATSSSAPQTPDQQAPATFRAAVDLVTVDVRVVDKSGRPMAGLTADDFLVSLDGKPSPVKVIDYLEFPTRSIAGGPSPAPSSANGAASGHPGRSILFGIDDRSIRVEDMPPYVQTISNAIGLLGDDDIAGLILPGGRSMPATRDRASLLKAVRSLSGKRLLPYVPVYVGVEEARSYQATRNASLVQSVTDRECGGTVNSELMDCTQTVELQFFEQGTLYERSINMQVDALRDMIEAARALPPPRILIVCSNGAALGTDKFADLKPIAEMALRADVQIEYLEQPPPNLDSASQTRTNFARASTSPSLMILHDRDERDLRRGGENIAEILGAPIHRFTMGADPALRELLVSWSGSYRLGLQPPDGVSGSRLVPLKVAVHRADAKVLANQRAFLGGGALADADARAAGRPDAAAGTAAPSPAPEVRLAEALASGTTTGVTLAIGAGNRRDEIGRDVQMVTVVVPKDVRGPVTAQFGVLDDTGKIVRRAAPELVASADGAWRAVFAVPLAPGHYRLRAAALDADGHLGVSELPIDITPNVIGPLAASDIFFVWKDEEGKTLLQTTDVIPASAGLVQATLELYAASASARLLVPDVQVSIARVGETKTIADWSLQPKLSVQGAQAAVALPWDDLAPGHYVVRVTITVPGAAPVTLTKAVTKGS